MRHLYLRRKKSRIFKLRLRLVVVLRLVLPVAMAVFLAQWPRILISPFGSEIFAALMTMQRIAGLMRMRSLAAS